MNERTRSLLGFRIIGAGKLTSGLLLLVAGVGLLRWIGDDFGLRAQDYLTKLHLDPDNQAIHELISRISGLTRKQLRLIQVGTFIYAGIHIVEGVGLLLAKRWAEYFTVLATGLLIPVEMYEIYEKPTALRITILVLNLGVVAYLIYRLKKSLKEAREERRIASDASASE